MSVNEFLKSIPEKDGLVSFDQETVVKAGSPPGMSQIA